MCSHSPQPGEEITYLETVLQEVLLMVMKMFSERAINQAQDSSALSRRAHDQEDSEMILTMKIAMEEKVNQIRAEYIENESVLIEANKFTMVNQYTQYYDSRIEHLQNILERHEREGRKRMIPLAKKNVENMIIEKEEKLASIQDAGIVEKEHKLISLSRISIVD